MNPRTHQAVLVRPVLTERSTAMSQTQTTSQVQEFIIQNQLKMFWKQGQSWRQAQLTLWMMLRKLRLNETLTMMLKLRMLKNI